MARIYLDACVFISHIRQEIGWNLRGLFVETDLFFTKMRTEKHTLVLSELFFFEVEKHTYQTPETVLAEFVRMGVIYECYTQEKKPILTEIEARRIHYPDSLHVGLALQSKCECIVTFNVRDFLPAKNWIRILLPGEL